MENITKCPKCLGAKEIMEARESRGFIYNKCNLCKGLGEINNEIANDYLFSLNEDNFEYENDK